MGNNVTRTCSICNKPLSADTEYFTLSSHDICADCAAVNTLYDLWTIGLIDMENNPDNAIESTATVLDNEGSE